MTSRWLISEIAEELGEEPFWHTQETFSIVESHLKRNPKTIVIDEMDYLTQNDTIELIRDLHDKTNCPIVLVGMAMADKKLARYPHLCDRIYKSLKFETFNSEDIKEILSELTELNFTSDAIEYLATRTNQFRQLVKITNKLEKLSATNDLQELDEYTLKGILNERRILTRLSEANAVPVKNLTECRIAGGNS